MLFCGVKYENPGFVQSRAHVDAVENNLYTDDALYNSHLSKRVKQFVVSGSPAVAKCVDEHATVSVLLLPYLKARQGFHDGDSA